MHRRPVRHQAAPVRKKRLQRLEVLPTMHFEWKRLFSYIHYLLLALNSIELATCLIAAEGTSPTIVSQKSPCRLPMIFIAPCCIEPSVRLCVPGSIKTEIAASPSEKTICDTSR